MKVVCFVNNYQYGEQRFSKMREQYVYDEELLDENHHLVFLDIPEDSYEFLKTLLRSNKHDNVHKTSGFSKEGWKRMYEEKLCKTQKDSKPKKTLNIKLWNSDNTLKPEVKDKVEEVVEKFKSWLEELKVTINIEDVVLVGSNTSYNYNAKSDLDIHIIVADSDETAMNLYDSYKSIFNKTYKIKFYNIPVEIYVQNDLSELGSKGIYSIYKGWVKEPNLEEIKDVDISSDFKSLEEEYKTLMEQKDVEKIKAFIDKLYSMRKDAILEEGEFAKGNLLFKEFRKRGHLKKLKQLQIKLESKSLSLGDVIRKKPEGFVIYSEKGKRLSKAYPSKEEAEKRLKQIEMFKHMKDAKEDVYEIRNVVGHYEAYKNGKFFTSGDTKREVEKEIEIDQMKTKMMPKPRKAKYEVEFVIDDDVYTTEVYAYDKAEAMAQVRNEYKGLKISAFSNIRKITDSKRR